MRESSPIVIGDSDTRQHRPRARSVDGHELSLPSWQAWSARDPLDERAFEQMVPLGIVATTRVKQKRYLPERGVALASHPGTTVERDLRAEAGQTEVVCEGHSENVGVLHGL